LSHTAGSKVKIFTCLVLRNKFLAGNLRAGLISAVGHGRQHVVVGRGAARAPPCPGALSPQALGDSPRSRQGHCLSRLSARASCLVRAWHSWSVSSLRVTPA